MSNLIAYRNANKIPNADATFDNFEAITGHKPTNWREFVAKNLEQLRYYSHSK